MSLTTLAKVKAAMGIPPGVTFHDSALGEAVSYANDYVLQVIGQSGGLVATTRTDYPDVYNPVQQDIQLSRVPVISVVALTNASTAVDSDDYRVDLETGKVRLSRGTVGTRRLFASWSDVPDDVVITYMHGYTSATVPGKLTGAAQSLAMHKFQSDKMVGQEEVRNSSYRTKADGLEIPASVANVLSEFQDVSHT